VDEVGEIDRECFDEETTQESTMAVEEEEEETENEQKFWKTAYDQAKITKNNWVQGCRRYNIPVARKSLALACPAENCLKQRQYMFPSYIPCSSKTGGGKYIGMVYNCIGCSSVAESREEEQESNIWSNYNPSKFALRYTQRARRCGIDNLSIIPVPYVDEQKVAIDLRKAAIDLPNSFDFAKVIEEIRDAQKKILKLLMKEQEQEEELPQTQATIEEEEQDDDE